ncbi:MAG: hypothetical protein K2L34_11980, partial [Muribaculaceae bacterium]|nr:hypothetical protein [Muribaculaceae bacterium]
LIDGGAELMALESADNTDMSNTNYVRFGSQTNDNQQQDPRQRWRAKHGSRRAFRGKLLAYVRITDPSQPATLHISSPLLQPYSLLLSTQGMP